MITIVHVGDDENNGDNLYSLVIPIITCQMGANEKPNLSMYVFASDTQILKRTEFNERDNFELVSVTVFMSLIQPRIGN